MSHTAQVEFCRRVATLFPDKFRNRKVLDVGSMDINGNNRWMAHGGSYLGIDIRPGKNVDRVCPVWDVPERGFEVVVSTEMLEHDRHWERSLAGMHERLAAGGVLLLTCAGPGRGVHGLDEFGGGHYGNLSPQDIMGRLPMESFHSFGAEYNGEAKDTYFWGICK